MYIHTPIFKHLHMHICTYTHSYTGTHIPGSTAQGGSGSFKDMKPIGEVRCCESCMAQQTT